MVFAFYLGGCPESLAFLDWAQETGPPATFEVSRSELTAALLQAVARPSLLGFSRLDALLKKLSLCFQATGFFPKVTTH